MSLRPPNKSAILLKLSSLKFSSTLILDQPLPSTYALSLLAYYVVLLLAYYAKQDFLATDV